MDSDMMNMMMAHIDKLPDFCTNPNPDSHNFTNPNLFYTQNQISPDPFPQEPGFRYPGSNHITPPPSLFDRRNNNSNNNNSSCNSMAAMREMIFRIAVMQPIQIDPEAVKPPKRRNVRISKDPQSVAARHRRERISERIRILQRLVPGGTKMDTASMLDEAIHYVKFLKKQVQSLEQQAVVGNSGGGGGGGIMMLPNNGAMGGGGCGGVGASHHQTVGNVQMLR